MPAWLIPAIGAAASLGGAILGNAQGIAKSNKQWRRQKEMADITLEHNKQLAQFNYDNQMKMWDETNYAAQKKQLEKAGLNPGLMYGMGGGGGATVNAAQAQGMSTPNVPSTATGTEAQQGASLGMALTSQLELLKAQKENIEADTANKQANAIKTAGIDTEVATMTKKLQDIQLKYEDGTLEQRIANIATEGSKLMAEAKSAIAKGNVDAATQETTIQQMEATLASTLLGNLLSQQQRKESEARINKMGEEIAQAWKKLELEDKNIAINQQLANLRAEFPDLNNVFARDIRAALDKMWNIINPNKTREEASKDYKK